MLRLVRAREARDVFGLAEKLSTRPCRMCKTYLVSKMSHSYANTESSVVGLQNHVTPIVPINQVDTYSSSGTRAQPAFLRAFCFE